jgi:hypothetical protein
MSNASSIPNNDFATAHRRSIYHRSELELVGRAACFYCLRRFATTEIREWTDDNRTALCPGCGIDAVLADTPISDEFLVGMRLRWFGED